MKELTKFLKKQRIEQGETAREMAARLNITPSYLSSIEHNKRKVPNWFYDRFTSVYKLNIEEEAIFKKLTIEDTLSDKEMKILKIAEHTQTNANYKKAIEEIIIILRETK